MKDTIMQPIKTIAAVADDYDVFFCDVWGVVHNGVAAFPDAVKALQALRAQGKCVIFVTNSPRLHSGVGIQMKELGVQDDSYDAIVTSGDATRVLIEEGPRKLFHIGDERSGSIFDGLDIELVEDFEAQGVVCTGLFNDDVETPDDYSELLQRLRSRNLPFICANPDLVVERGNHMIWCAGALARDYGLMGGRVFLAGKPHRPIYDLALKTAEQLKGPIDKKRILAIGDGILTDVKGGEDFGLDVLFIYGGIHAADYTEQGVLDRQRLDAFLKHHGAHPVAVSLGLI